MKQSTLFEDLASNYRVIFFDAYGVLRNSKGILPGIPQALHRLRESGLSYYVITNDASRSPDVMAETYQADEHGLLVPPDRIISSGLLASEYLEGNVLRGRVAYLGTPASAWYIERAGHEAVPLGRIEHDDEIAAIAFLDDEGFDWAGDLNHALNLLRMRTLPVLIANADHVYPTGGGRTGLAIGSLADMLERTVAKTFLHFGKPDAQILDYAFDLARVEHPALSKREVLMVGDTLETDILAGAKFGIDTALVLSGNTPPDHARAWIDASGIIPRYIVPSVSGS